MRLRGRGEGRETGKKKRINRRWRATGRRGGKLGRRRKEGLRERGGGEEEEKWKGKKDLWTWINGGKMSLYTPPKMYLH